MGKCQLYVARRPSSIFYFLNCIPRDQNSTYKRGLNDLYVSRMSYFMLKVRCMKSSKNRLDLTN